MTAMGIIQNLQESLGHVLNNMSRVVCTEAIRTKTIQNMSTAMRPPRKHRLFRRIPPGPRFTTAPFVANLFSLDLTTETPTDAL
ncbi:hypothetical protein pdam_00021902 [Pocillopora damicornis]|uniref:Uncharacterized protein n=1 Tax=Pocillopora damicornis TaxID=46731 RepID=A0A3M6TN39_POCDA|nr:hypothetical protein pdam_00021902 [Pocillopora damicornis]